MINEIAIAAFVGMFIGSCAVFLAMVVKAEPQPANEDPCDDCCTGHSWNHRNDVRLWRQTFEDRGLVGRMKDNADDLVRARVEGPPEKPAIVTERRAKFRCARCEKGKEDWRTVETVESKNDLW